MPIEGLELVQVGAKVYKNHPICNQTKTATLNYENLQQNSPYNNTAKNLGSLKLRDRRKNAHGVQKTSE